MQSSFLPGGSRGGNGISALVCGTCGAPLSSQKARPLAPGKGARLPGAGERPTAALSHKSAGKKAKHVKGKKAKHKPSKVKKVKKRKGLFHVLLSEAVDLVEDIFD
ncbi:MAG: hypothetical protein BM558_08240 [Roseobacter sp. MedPE-SW]|nr:MAG: hypothetical protein BM558_08240 [Roseobacter sp. MedPE-SW]